MPDDLAIMNDVVGYLAEPARGIMLAKANKPGGGGFGVPLAKVNVGLQR